MVLERNLDVGRGELDVVARGPGGSFVVEVKTGVGGDAEPEEAFDPDKAQQVRDLAGRLPGRIDRVDLITVQLAPEGVRIWWTPHAG